MVALPLVVYSKLYTVQVGDLGTHEYFKRYKVFLLTIISYEETTKRS